MAMSTRSNKALLKSIILAAMMFCPEGTSLFPSTRHLQAKEASVDPSPPQVIKIAMVYDNNPYDSRLRSDWGFSCLAVLRERAILFDTGADGLILRDNMKKLGIDPKVVSEVFLSHIHADHVGGLSSFLRQNSNVTVYLPASFPDGMKEEIRYREAALEEVRAISFIFYTNWE